MNSEKVKEIKKKLQEEIFIATKFDDKLRRVETKDLQDILTLINEFEECSKKWQKLCADEVALNKPLKERIKELETLCNKTYEDLTKEIDRLENRVKELEDGIAKSMLGCEFLPECTNDKLKQFAKRLKEKAKILTLGSVKVSNFLWVNDIDETLKEFIED